MEAWIWNLGRCKGWCALSGSGDLGLGSLQRIVFRTGRHEVVGWLLVASYWHPAEHGVMNTGVYVPRGIHFGVEVDIHISMHAKIRTNVITSIIYVQY